MKKSSMSVLHKFDESHLFSEPFPHIVIENAIDDDTYMALTKAFPPKEQFIRKLPEHPNRYYWLEAIRILNQFPVSSVWHEFVSYHTSIKFLEELKHCILKDSIAKHLPAAKYLCKKGLSTGVRFSQKDLQVALDAQSVYCTPTLHKPGSPRGAHVDREVTAFSGLLYFGKENSPSEGGDLILYKRKSIQDQNIEFDSSNHVSHHLLEEVKRIPYGSNKFVGFVNSPAAIHGVSAREISLNARRHINIIAEAHCNLFNLIKLKNDGPHRYNSWYGNLPTDC